jgi:hypothetical protein
MRELLIAVTLIAANPGTQFAQQRTDLRKAKAMVVAFYDQDRLRGRRDGRDTLEGFKFFLNPIQEIVKQDFPDVEFRILTKGTLLRLPDGTGLNVQNMEPTLGLVLSAQGRKRRIMSGVQSEQDFACAAAAFFRRSSTACSK